MLKAGGLSKKRYLKVKERAKYKLSFFITYFPRGECPPTPSIFLSRTVRKRVYIYILLAKKANVKSKLTKNNIVFFNYQKNLKNTKILLILGVSTEAKKKKNHTNFMSRERLYLPCKASSRSLLTRLHSNINT